MVEQLAGIGVRLTTAARGPDLHGRRLRDTDVQHDAASATSQADRGRGLLPDRT